MAWSPYRLLRLQDVSDAAHRLNQIRRAWNAEQMTQSIHCRRDACGINSAAIPKPLGKFVPAEHDTRMFDQILQQLKLEA